MRSKRTSKKKPNCRVPFKRRRHESLAEARRRKRRRKAYCEKQRRRKAKRPATRAPAPPPPVQPVPPPPRPPAAPAPFRLPTPVSAHSGPFGIAQAERLLWRAGFGPSPGHAQALAAMGLHRAVASLTRPSGAAVLTGAAPVDGDGAALAPEDVWGHDHLWWLDRMVRTNQPLVERMTLVWHDWFATSLEASSQRLMLEQNELFRRSAFGSFRTLARDVTANPAMILWLNLRENSRFQPNENYARELMELFTLGADRGAYTETDVRQLARALTGFTYDWSSELGPHNFRFDPNRHDPGSKTVFGRTGAFGWADAVDLCIDHPLHASFFVSKLWSYFIPVPPSAQDLAALAQAYVAGGRQVRPVLEAILLHPQLHGGPRMVKPPVVFEAGMLRALRQAIDTEDWWWLAQVAGQRLFLPPDVAGWDNDRWLDTGTVRGRWLIVERAMRSRYIRGTEYTGYDATETAPAALAKALEFWGGPRISSEAVAALTAFADGCVTPQMASWQQRQYRAGRQNALRQLIFCGPDLQVA
jgi:hypothetical protein